MPEASALGDVRESRGSVVSRFPRSADRRERFVVEQNRATGPRLKCYSRTADVSYWTDLWRRRGEESYARERHGHLPHQLRATFRRWVSPGARVLEAGCGLGHFTVAADALGYRVEGLDWSQSTIDTLRQRFSWIGWHVGDARQLEFADGVFDAVYSPGVCEHFEEGPEAVLTEMHRVLRGGGIAVLSTPCFNVWLQQRASCLTAGGSETAVEFYQYAFTPEGMAELLGRLGFDVLQIHPYAALDTMIRHGGWRVPSRAKRALAYAMDCLPVVRHWGSTCIWVARKC